MSNFSQNQFDAYTAAFCERFGERLGVEGINLEDVARLKIEFEQLIGSDMVHMALQDARAHAGRILYPMDPGENYSGQVG